MTPFLRTLIVSFFLGLIVSGTAFTSPLQQPTSSRAVTASSAESKTVLHFKFLKDLGLEKPSWLPDFGGSKEEEEAPPAPAEATATEEGEEEAATADSEE